MGLEGHVPERGGGEQGTPGEQQTQPWRQRGPQLRPGSARLYNRQKGEQAVNGGQEKDKTMCALERVMGQGKQRDWRNTGS